MNKQWTLIAVERGESRANKLKAFKTKHGILTHRTSGMKREDHPWIALIPSEEDQGKDIGTIMAESCRIYEEQGRLATGEGELSAIRQLCNQLNIEQTQI